MSLFSPGKTISVASTIYNLAGDVNKRPNFLNTTVLGIVMGSGSPFFGEQLNNAYLKGPGVKLRTFADWVRQPSGYDSVVGITASPLLLTSAIDPAILGPLLPAVAGESISIQSSEIGIFDFTFWVDQYLVNNDPSQLNTAYTCDFDGTTGIVTINLVGGTVLTFTITSFDASAQYLYAVWNYQLTSVIAEVPAAATGTPAVVSGGTSGFAVNDTVVLTGGTFTTATVLKVTGVDGSGAITSVSILTPGAYTVAPTSPVSISSTSGAGVGSPTFTVSYSTYVPLTPATFGPLQFLAYKQNSGNTALDALFIASTSSNFFLPFIPIIVGSNNYISPTFKPTLYPWVVEAVQKSMGANYDDIVASIKLNPSANQIDVGVIVFAVCLNTKEKACKNYIYQFFLQIMTGLSLSSPAFAAWQAAWNTANATWTVWATWQVAQSNPSDPLYGTPAPATIPYPASPTYSLSVESTGIPDLAYYMIIAWDSLTETTGSGVLTNADTGHPAKVGDFWFEVVTNVNITASAFINATVGTLPYTQTQQHIRLNWQVGSSNWRALDIYNLTHYNKVILGKSIITTGIFALGAASESGFLIPLNQTVYESMSLADSTQMATACCYLVFNSFTITIAPWWSAGIFQVLLIVVAIALVVATAGAATPGLLGTDLAVGAALGLTGVAAVILGAVVNSIAAIILVQLIEIGATKVLGNELGPILGIIVGLIALQVGTVFANGMGASQVLNLMMQPSNILKLTEAVGNAFTQAIQLATQKTVADTQTMQAKYNAADAQVEDQYQAMFGSDDGADLTLNPLSLIDVSLPNVTPSPLMAESPTDFLSRTLMTGSDISGLSLSFITNFCEASLSTKLPGLT